MHVKWIHTIHLKLSSTAAKNARNDMLNPTGHASFAVHNSDCARFKFYGGSARFETYARWCPNTENANEILDKR